MDWGTTLNNTLLIWGVAAVGTIFPKYFSTLYFLIESCVPSNDGYSCSWG